MAGVPESEIKARLRDLRKCMRRSKLGAFWLTRPEDVHYFSGFSGSDTHLLVTAGQLILLTDSRYSEEAEKSAPLAELLLWKKSQAGFAGEVMRKKRIRKVGIASDALSFAEYQRFTREARRARLVPEDAGLEAIRAIKSDWEVRKIRTAIRCAEEAFGSARTRFQPGMTEADVRLELEWEMRRRGASDAAFETIVAFRANASLPHAHAGGRRLRSGGGLLIDFGARVDHYNSDLTRVLFLGSIPKLWRKWYRRVLEAQAEAIRTIAAGVKAAEADAAARNVLQKHGCASHFTHSLGHGLGLAVHEAPRLSSKSDQILKAGMAVTVEPGVYYPKQGGIRIEDDVLVTEKGCKVLSSLGKEIEDMVI